VALLLLSNLFIVIKLFVLIRCILAGKDCYHHSFLHPLISTIWAACFLHGVSKPIRTMKQSALTLISPVRDVVALRQAFQDKQQPLQEALRQVGTIHYARWVIVDEAVVDGKVLQAQLAFGSNCDGDPDKHILDLVDTLGPLLDVVYTHCEAYTPENRADYLRHCRTQEAAFYQGSPGRTVPIIAQEKALHNRLLEALRSKDWTGMSAKEIHLALQAAVLGDPDFSWARQPIHTPKVNWFVLVIMGVCLLIASPFIVCWAVYMQLAHERKDIPGTTTPNQVPDTHIQAMQRHEDFSYQNQFSQIIDMKPGPARLFTVQLLYFVTRILIRLLFVKGELMGIPTIHFARWVMLNDNRRMLFFSNFDGSWTQYLGDFIDKSGWGLTGIFGNTMYFPRSLFLVFRGAYDERHFLGWSRSTQIATQLWYTADVSQSIKNINDNTLIRNGLSRSLNEKQAQQFLSKL